MSPNIQDGGTETPSRKRSLKDYLEGANSDAAKAKATSTAASAATKANKLQLVTDVKNLAALEKDNEQQQQQQQQQRPGSPTTLLSPDSPLSEMSDGPLSLLTDAGSSTPARRSVSPNATPCKSSAGASPQLVISIDATPPAGLLTPNGGKQHHQQPPPAKRKRLTPSEREEKAKADAARKLDREKAEAARKQEKERAEATKKQERDEQKAVADAKKRAVADEKEKKRKQKEDEDRRKNEEKDKKRKEKEDEERKVQEAKDKKERSQLRLNSFFKTGGSSTSATASATTPGAGGALLPGGGSPLKAVTAAAASSAARGSSASPRKAGVSSLPAGSSMGAAGTSSESSSIVVEISEYDRIFKPFFVKENVIVATSLYGMDDETKEAKSRILDEFLSGTRGAFSPTKPFSAASAVDYFHLPCDQSQRPLHRLPRGRSRPAVRKIMKLMGSGGSSLDAQDDAQDDAQAKLAQNLLKTVPMKYLSFREDVRPAYFGTITSQPPQARMAKLARNPLAKSVLPLNYDYDSEAEWVDDGDGEDVDVLDDDEDELDDDGEMSDFLDDSEDAIPLRPAFLGGMEPESTGVCWENERRKAPRPELDNFRMEFILDHDGAMDPFSTQYWETKEPAPAADTPAALTSTPGKAMAPPPVPTDAFAALGAGAAAVATVGPSSAATSASPASKSTPTTAQTTTATAAGASGKAADPKKTAGVAAEFVPDLKKSILQYAKLSKLGIVEILSAEFVGKCTKNQIKNSLEALAERTGTGQHKTWKFKV